MGFINFNTSNRTKENRKYETSYVCGPGSTPLLGLTIGQLLENTANKYGDREAVVVIHQNIRKTYQQLLNDVWIISKLFTSSPTYLYICFHL